MCVLHTPILVFAASVCVCAVRIPFFSLSFSTALVPPLLLCITQNTQLFYLSNESFDESKFNYKLFALDVRCYCVSSLNLCRFLYIDNRAGALTCAIFYLLLFLRRRRRPHRRYKNIRVILSM